jgi:DNA-binding NarL/FixJ family response regulator
VIRLVIVDDHSVVRAGLEQLAKTFDGVDLVGTAADGREAVERCLETRPDVVLMDLEMPEMDGIEATHRIVEQSPATQVVILTSFSDRDRIVSALNAGAVGYILKDAAPDEIAEAIRAAARGESPLDPKAARTLIAARREPVPSSPLSERELEVLLLVAEGLQNKQISLRLGISEKTVKAHLTSVFRAIGVIDRTQAALWAERNRLTRRS